jgi:aminocarboxymuconate-semialdehyde decarboxylase
MATTGATNVRKKAAPAKITRRKNPRIDIHTHVELPEVKELAGKIKMRGKGPGKQDWVSPASAAEHTRQTKLIMPKLTDPKVRLKDMDAMGVDIQVLSSNLPTPAYWANGKTGQAVARACNEGVAGMVSADPDRFVGIGAVPLQDIDRAIDELDYAVNALGLRGAIIPSNIRNHDLGEEMFRPFWAKAEALGAVIYIHPRGFTHAERLEKFFLWNSVGQPLEEALAMASLIHEGIMDAFPKLKILVGHGGGYLPYYSGRSDKSFDSRPEARANITRYPSDYMKRFYYDSVVFDRDMLAYLVKKVGDRQIMMGTDYPRGEVEEDPVGFVTRTRGISKESKDRIMSRNAARLFNIAV